MSTMFHRLFFVWLPALALGAALAGCAGYSPRGVTPGMPADEVIARMGRPTGEHRLADGTRRLEFARGPYGKHTYMVDLDAQDRVLRWQQVLTEAVFNAIPRGISREEVLRRIGRPSHEMLIPRRNERVWSYRYESPFCQWFQVSLDLDTHKVTETGYNVDPICDANDNDLDPR